MRCLAGCNASRDRIKHHSNISDNDRNINQSPRSHEKRIARTAIMKDKFLSLIMHIDLHICICEKGAKCNFKKYRLSSAWAVCAG